MVVTSISSVIFHSARIKTRRVRTNGAYSTNKKVSDDVLTKESWIGLPRTHKHTGVRYDTIICPWDDSRVVVSGYKTPQCNNASWLASFAFAFSLKQQLASYIRRLVHVTERLSSGTHLTVADDRKWWIHPRAFRWRCRVFSLVNRKVAYH